MFAYDGHATVYYLPGTTGWVFSANTGLTPVLWNPLIQTGDGSFGVLTNGFGFNITGSSDLVIVVEASTNLANPLGLRRNQYPHRRLVLFQRSAVDELSRPLLPPPLAVSHG